jgi:hypothetical protein
VNFDIARAYLIERPLDSLCAKNFTQPWQKGACEYFNERLINEGKETLTNVKTNA